MAKRQCFQIPGVAHSGGGPRGFLPFGTRIGDWLFSGGCMGQDPANGQVVQGAENQAAFAFRNVQTLLDTAGLTPENIVHMFVWLKSNEHRNAVNEPWLEMFPDPEHRPARHAIEADLPGTMLVQLEFIARRGHKAESIHIPGVAHGAPIPFACMAGDFVCSGGIQGQDPATSKRPDSLEAEADLCFQNLQAMLDAAGASPADVGHMFVWYKDHTVRDAVNKPFTKMFPTQGNRPARHAITRPLPGGVNLQIEVMLQKGGGRKCFEIPGEVAHTGGGVKGFIPFGTRNGQLLHSGATFGADPKTGKLGKTPERQAELCFENTKTLMETAGMSMDDIAHMFVWYKDHAFRDAVNGPWVKHFPNIEDRPARHAIKADLPGEMAIQIEIVAVGQ